MTPASTLEMISVKNYNIPQYWLNLGFFHSFSWVPALCQRLAYRADSSGSNDTFHQYPTVFSFEKWFHVLNQKSVLWLWVLKQLFHHPKISKSVNSILSSKKIAFVYQRNQASSVFWLTESGFRVLMISSFFSWVISIKNSSILLKSMWKVIALFVWKALKLCHYLSKVWCYLECRMFQKCYWESYA